MFYIILVALNNYAAYAMCVGGEKIIALEGA